MPVLEEDDGFILPESAVIMEYLEDLYPEPALLPGDSRARALARVWIDRFDARLGDVYYAVRRGEDGVEALEGKFAGLDRALVSSPYLTGDEFGLADIAYAPWILRAQANLGASIDGFDGLSDWVDRLTARPAVGAEVEIVEALAG